MTSPTEQSDADLMDAFRRSPDPAIVEELHRRHDTALRLFLCNRAGSHGEDLAQETWIRLQTKLAEATADHFRGWLFQIAKNLLRDHHRGEQRRQANELSPDAAQTTNSDPAEAAMNSEQHHQLEHCFGKLAASDQVLARGRLGGESYEELQTTTGKTTEQLQRRWHEVMRQLRICVEGRA